MKSTTSLSQAGWPGVAPPVGARGADSFKRLLGCSLSRETSEAADRPPGKPAAARSPGRPACNATGACRTPWIALVLSDRRQGGAPDQSCLSRDRTLKRQELPLDTTSAVLLSADVRCFLTSRA